MSERVKAVQRALGVAQQAQDTDGPGIHHLYCYACGSDGAFAICGEDIADLPETDASGEIRCVVCYDLELHPCEKCGAE